jgi:starch synthase
MQIVQATFAVFHSFELAHQLHRRNHLRKIFSTWPWARLKREGLPRSLVGTFPLIQTADYYLARSPLYRRTLASRIKPAIATTFDEYTLRLTPPCDAFIALSGAGLLTGPLVQSRGGRFICDRGSTHHRFQEEVIAHEFRRWQVKHQPEAPGVIERDEAIYALADAITVPSSAARRSFLEKGLPAEKVHVIPYGVRLEQFQKTADPPANSFELLFAGQVSLRKGIPYLLQAFARLNHPRKHLTVVGTVQDHIQPVLEHLSTDHVTFLGSIPQPELIERMGRSHALILPSVEEGLALVLAQAMACQCPVVATQATGAEDLFTDGVEGYIVPDRNITALTERLQRLADDPTLRDRMAAAALARVKTLGGWNQYGERWDRLLHQLTGLPTDTPSDGPSDSSQSEG